MSPLPHPAVKEKEKRMIRATACLLLKARERPVPGHGSIGRSDHRGLPDQRTAAGEEESKAQPARHPKHGHNSASLRKATFSLELLQAYIS